MERYCHGCGRMQGLDQFSFKDAEKGILHSRCRECDRQFARQHYARENQAYLERNRRNNPAQRDAARRFVHEFLLAHPCVQCGEADPVVLEFNHLDPTTKSGNVCDLIHARSSLARLRAEIAKCEVLCANCHQRHTTLARPVHYKCSGVVGARAGVVRNQVLVLQYLAAARCVDCQEGDPLVLQFDHRHGKSLDIATLAGTGCNRQRLAEELAKCEVRCANCHRRRTAQTRNWFRTR